MIPLWSKRAFTDALDGENVGTLHSDITGISIDTRTLQDGDAFFAIQGERFDGHDFIQAAVKNGASVLVVARKHAGSVRRTSVPLVIVDNVLVALGKLAEAARRRSHAKIVAITGSVGKTTTKEILRHALSTVGRVHANLASFNNHWGLPLTLARLPIDADFGIFEIGMNHENEIRQLARLVEPDLVIITCIAAVHLGYFTSIETIADAKAEIFEGLKVGGTALLNADDRFFTYLAKKAQKTNVAHIVSFGEAAKADYRLLNVHLHTDCSCFKVILDGQEAMVKIGAPGYHMVQNALAVLSAGDILRADIARLSISLQNFIAGSGRGGRYKLILPSGGIFLLIDESYNANPVSMRAGLSLLANSHIGRRGRRIAVLGDMLELGSFSRKAHEKLSKPMREANVSLAFLGGQEMKYLADILRNDLQIFYRKTVADLLPLVLNEIRSGDVVMVKSSNGSGSSRLVSALLDRYKLAQS
ncbi:MAG: UDP-N-acetylmuramoyl-tripeptide--D-alanyl-D-alanine ligase [Candidatus Tokpelaia sp. JSC189]|nr:MAG: UDP-N-acetylmuramoyl-tripeptide--D-alanyl-D-alanine ligase [Candidatus Tokpelaia sp. JSC189]